MININFLGHATGQDLDVSQLVFGPDELARVVGQGTSYGGGYWEIAFHAFTPQMKPVDMKVIGSCSTLRAGTAEQAFGTMSEWLRAQVEQHDDLKFAYAEDRNHERPEDERPFFLAGLFLIDKR